MTEHPVMPPPAREYLRLRSLGVNVAAALVLSLGLDQGGRRRRVQGRAQASIYRHTEQPA